MKHPPKEHLTPDGAHALAARLRQYWKDRGYAIETKLEVIREHGTITCVRSNLKNGMPPGYWSLIKDEAA